MRISPQFGIPKVSEKETRRWSLRTEDIGRGSPFLSFHIGRPVELLPVITTEFEAGESQFQEALLRLNSYLEQGEAFRARWKISMLLAACPGSLVTLCELGTL